MLQTKLDGFFIWIGDSPGRNKITIGLGEKNIHYTLVIKEDKRVIDIHKTYVEKREKRYEQLLEMNFYTFMRLIVHLKQTLLSVVHESWTIKRINIGKLKRHKLVLFGFNQNEDTTKQFLNLKRSKKIGLNKSIDISAIENLLNYPDDISIANESTFWVWSTSKGKFKRQGLIFRLPNDPRKSSFYLITNKDFSKFSRLYAIAFYKALNQVNFKNKENVMNTLSGYLK